MNVTSDCWSKVCQLATVRMQLQSWQRRLFPPSPERLTGHGFNVCLGGRVTLAVPTCTDLYLALSIAYHRSAA